MNRSGVRFPQVAPSELALQHLAGDLAGGSGGGEARVSAGVLVDFGDLVAELAVAQTGLTVRQRARQQLAEDVDTLFTHLCHGIQTGVT